MSLSAAKGLSANLLTARLLTARMLGESAFGSGAVLPVWAAASSNYMLKGAGSHEMKAQLIGVGSLTVVSPDGLLLPTDTGLFRAATAANLPTWHGARWADVLSEVEEVVNGTFATDTDWNKDAGWSIAGGKATHALGASANYLTQAGILAIGKKYAYSIDVIAGDASNFP
ncbi:MAG: hypothetical protein KAU50_08800, partial [Candidatus Marinimicrobia bacterium]|nr:hypothetical protein [Candidatus Neomarinimicrobiota bacterium]